MTPISEILFWTSASLVGATYVLYPVLLFCWPKRRQLANQTESPAVTLVISAFNEAAVIREKIENSLSLDYPNEKLEIMVISDASDDGTDEIVREFRAQGVVLFRQTHRQGKSAALSEFVPKASGEIIVFSDANSLYAPDAVSKLVRHFGDPAVGYVVGHQGYVEQHGAASASESIYWRYETLIKQLESRVSSVVGGDGAIFAIRAHLFEPLREDDINDFVIPLKIVTNGFRGIFDREAVCYEKTAIDFRGEFRRKVRIVNRSLRAVFRVPQALNPFKVGLFAFQLLAHKVIRWFAPFFLLSMLLINILLASVSDGVLYPGLLSLQILFYLLASLRFVPRIGDTKLVYVPYYFCVVNLAAGIGILGILFGMRFVTWSPQRSQQTEDGAEPGLADTGDPSNAVLSPPPHARSEGSPR